MSSTDAVTTTINNLLHKYPAMIKDFLVKAGIITIDLITKIPEPVIIFIKFLMIIFFFWFLYILWKNRYSWIYCT